ncbi:hypothetical protein [uncultured Roseovarius sp.]|uniref:hypothetical protein n=1 Tax=uncultured Roseovarius sp. TaxID=293344 RepID=UPI00263800DA|nr:hypothetical protein [uncultured Roseovarius sp.]
MKAGSAGSIPDGVTKVPQASQPLRYFLHDVGDAVASLNTTVVGLDAVENGYAKPDSLNISWNPIDQKAAARKARRFVLEAVLVRVSEALSQYIGAISKLPRFENLRESWAKDAKNKIKISDAKKLSDLAKEIIQSDCFLAVGGCLLVHWRNRAVHRDSQAKLTGPQAKILIRHSALIDKEFASLSVDRLLRDFEEGKPTLKDITSLVAMTIRLSRKLDAKINDTSKADLLALLEHYGLDKKIEKLKLETSPQRQTASIIRFLETTAPGLAEPFVKFHGE